MKNAAILSFLLAGANADASVSNDLSDGKLAANPIRKVVTMLQKMEKKVEEEGERDAELYKKFSCYCKNAGSDLQTSIAAAGDKVPQVTASIEEAEGQAAQLKQDLVKHKSDREAAKGAIAEATAIREKEAAAFASMHAEYTANIDAVTKATKAVESGMAGFLQTTQASVLRRLVQSSSDLVEMDRQEVLAFLTGGQTAESDYSPQSGEITGILKGLGDEMKKTLGEATDTEEAAKKVYDELMAAKSKEVEACTKAVEDKTVRSGELAVSIVNMKNDLSDTQAALLEDQKFLEDLDGNCEKREKEYQEVVQTRSTELQALAEVIKLLQDDDALELFKKTLPSGSSFVQMKTEKMALREKALALLKASRPASELDFIALALKGKKVSFDKVIKMIDEMTALLKQEQVDDDNKKEYCTVQFDSFDDKKKGLEKSISDAEAAISSAEEDITAITGEMKALDTGIKELDKSVAEASEQRKEEHEEYTTLLAQNNAAIQLIGMAKNRLNKFYNPKLYKAPPKTELSREDRIVENMSGTAAPTEAPGGIAGTGIAVFAEVTSHEQQQVAPPPPPETFGAYQKKSEDGMGVMAMVDLLIADLDKEMTEAETTEKDAQADYETAMKDAADKRTADSKLLGEKETIKAETEADLESKTEDKAAAGAELMSTMKYISSLHMECDWLLKYFDVRKEARASEIDALGKAKAVLSGADYSFVQTKAQRFLRRSA